MLTPVIMILGLLSAVVLVPRAPGAGREHMLEARPAVCHAWPASRVDRTAGLVGDASSGGELTPLIPWPGLPRAPQHLTLIAHALLPESVHAQPELEHYLVEHQGQATYLAATINASTAAPFILDTGKAVMAIGGFNGFDTILTAQQVAALVERGTVRFFLLPSFAPDLLSTVPTEYRAAFEAFLRLQQVNQDQMPLPIQPTIVQWVNAHCQVVPRSVAEPGLAGPATTVDLGETETFPTQLFDCTHVRSAGAAADVAAQSVATGASS